MPDEVNKVIYFLHFIFCFELCFVFFLAGCVSKKWRPMTSSPEMWPPRVQCRGCRTEGPFSPWSLVSVSRLYVLLDTQHCVNVWNSLFDLWQLHHESQAASNPNTAAMRRAVCLAGENKPLALWEIHQKPPFITLSCLLRQPCIAIVCDLSTAMELILGR